MAGLIAALLKFGPLAQTILTLVVKAIEFLLVTVPRAVIVRPAKYLLVDPAPGTVAGKLTGGDVFRVGLSTAAVLVAISEVLQFAAAHLDLLNLSPDAAQIVAGIIGSIVGVLTLIARLYTDDNPPKPAPPTK